MDKITIIPSEVRGYGDIVSPKTLEDFVVYDSELSFEDSLYTLAYDNSGISVGLTVSSGTISVGSSVTLTAEVLSEGEPASGETVSFYDGSTLLGTDETDSDGIAIYTASSLSVGSHSLTAVALGKSSLAVTVTVNKLTSTITLSVPASGTVGTSYSITGTLVPTSGSVKLYENSVLKDTLTVSSGTFSKAITQSNEGTYSYYAVFEGSSTYASVTSSTGSIVVSDVPTPTVTSVSLTGDKSILSYADSESATLSATVLDQSSQPMSGVTVEFFKGSTSMGTADTNSSGVATKSYASAGVGDVSFTAVVGTIVSETYSIEDCILANVNKSYTGTSSSDTVYSLGYDEIADLSSTDFEMTWDFKQTSYGCDVCLGASSEFSVSPIKSNYRVFIGNSSGGHTRQGYRTTSTTNTNGSISGEVSLNTVHNMKIVKEGSTFSYYLGTKLLGTRTVSFWSDYNMFGVHTVQWNKGTTTISNLKIKPL